VSARKLADLEPALEVVEVVSQVPREPFDFQLLALPDLARSFLVLHQRDSPVSLQTDL
jgi:hypothetical protein